MKILPSPPPSLSRRWKESSRRFGFRNYSSSYNTFQSQELGQDIEETLHEFIEDLKARIHKDSLKLAVYRVFR